MDAIAQWLGIYPADLWLHGLAACVGLIVLVALGSWLMELYRVRK